MRKLTYLASMLTNCALLLGVSLRSPAHRAGSQPPRRYPNKI